MITHQQANIIRDYLIKELNNNGFGDIVIEVNTRLEEQYEEEKFIMQPRYLLDFYLAQCIEVLENLSNKNFQELINRFNKFTKGEINIKTINVELLNSGEQFYYDLSELPDYYNIISIFREILTEIRKEN